LMESWTKKSHYPLVKIKRAGINVSGVITVTVTQEPFLLNQEAEVPDTIWQIPIMASASDGSATGNKTFLLTAKRDAFWIDNNASSFLKLNVGQYGFYRVLYDDQSWRKLLAVMKTSITSLDAVDRAGILDDAFNLARAGKLEYEKALNALEYLDKEVDYIPWNIVSSALNYITNNYEGPQIQKWRVFVAKKAAKALETIGFEVDPKDSFSTRNLRPYLISLACKHGDRKCLLDAKNAFDEWQKNGIAVDVDVRSQIYRYGMIDAGDEQWTKVHDVYKATTVPQEKKKLRYAMAMPKTPWILKRYIEYARNEDQGFKSQDYFGIMELIADNPVGLPIAWDYIKSHWEEIVKRFTINDRYLGRMINRIISHFNTKFQLKDVEAFFKAYPDAGAGARAREQGLTNIKDNMAWRDKFEASLTTWLEKQ